MFIPELTVENMWLEEPPPQNKPHKLKKQMRGLICLFLSKHVGKAFEVQRKKVPGEHIQVLVHL